MKKRNHLKLDVNSPYYHVCLYPECSEPFMSTNSQQLYHDPRCADQHYNLFRKLKKLKLERREKEFDDEPIISPVTPGVPPPEKTEPTSAFEINPEKVDKNIEIFSRLSVDKKNGTIYSIRFVEELGVDLRHYSFFYPLCNVKRGYCVMYGNFLTFLVSPLEILIYYKP